MATVVIFVVLGVVAAMVIGDLVKGYVGLGDIFSGAFFGLLSGMVIAFLLIPMWLPTIEVSETKSIYALNDTCDDYLYAEDGYNTLVYSYMVETEDGRRLVKDIASFKATVVEADVDQPYVVETHKEFTKSWFNIFAGCDETVTHAEIVVPEGTEIQYVATTED